MNLPYERKHLYYIYETFSHWQKQIFSIAKDLSHRVLDRGTILDKCADLRSDIAQFNFQRINLLEAWAEDNRIQNLWFPDKDSFLETLKNLENKLTYEDVDVKELKDELLTLDDYFLKDILQEMDKIGEPYFTINGISIQNPMGLQEIWLKKFLQNIEEGIVLCKRKGVEPKTFLNRVILMPRNPQRNSAEGWAYTGQKTLALTLRVLNNGPYTFIHELGHLIEDELDLEAVNNYKQPWEDGTNKDTLDIPTDYGKTNYKEDWAETFVYFILHPEKLSETALYRIKRALWLSQDRNKKVIDRVARAKKVPLNRRD
jgi:hypothetical protein